MKQQKNTRCSDFGEANGGQGTTVNEIINRKKRIRDKGNSVKLPAAIEAVKSLLSFGQESGLHASEIQAVTGLTPRDQRHAVQWMREHGDIVIGDSYGYYLPGSISEIEAWVRRIEAVIKTLQRAVASAKKYLKTIRRDNPDQLTLWDIDHE